MRTAAKNSTLRLLIRFAIICFLFLLVVFVIRGVFVENIWQKRSSSFVKQVNELGATMKPGEVGTIYLADCDADVLVMLPAYCTNAELRDRLSDVPAVCVDMIERLPRDDHTCPALVWLRNGHIVSVNRTIFSVGFNLIPHSWKLDNNNEIRVKKEVRSPNGFLSLYFLEDCPSPIKIDNLDDGE